MTDSFHQRVIDVLCAVPTGRVVTYGQVASMAGDPRAARQVVRVLHSSSRKEALPWHRVINSRGRISLPRGGGFELQRALLRDEGVRVTDEGAVILKYFQWSPGKTPD